jgi:predicted Na+-dependent transporter
MNPLLNALAWSARRGSILLAIGIFGGILSPALAADFKFFITPNVLLMTTLVLLRVDIPAALGHLRRPARLAFIVALQMLACPILAWLVVRPLQLDPGIEAGIVLLATGCAAISSAAFARLVGLDPELSLLTTLATLALVSFTAPSIALWLLGIDLAIGTTALMTRLLLVIGLPLLVSLLLRRLLGRDNLVRWGEAFDGALVWIVVFYGFAVMDGLAPRLAADPAWVAQALLAAFVADYGLNLLTTGILWRTGVRTAATAGLMSGNRNMALYLAVLPATTDPRITLFFGLCQIPLFLSPFLLRPLYRQLLSWAARPAGARWHR